jgi:hypothetical protein
MLIIMLSKARFGIAALLMFVALATAPAMRCLGYLASSCGMQHGQSHSCCHPKPASGDTVVPTCCIHIPAMTSKGTDVPPPSVAMVTPSAVEAQLLVVSVTETSAAPHLDTSPPSSSSILRI